MCGISGIYNYCNQTIDSKKIIEKIIKLQHNRGPDDSGTWISECNKVNFGHNRLSIIDLTKNAKQPFISNDKKIALTYNGEIYNFKEIKSELIKKKVFFRSNSDTEVIVEAYKYWGIDFINRLRGMFAFALWDDAKKELVLARDPFGIKPLYYAKKNNIYYFASSINSILSIYNLNFKKSDKGIVSYYLWGNVQEPFTLYEDIKSIQRGTCKIVNHEGIEKDIIYADIKDEIINAKKIDFSSENESKLYLKNIIDETVEYHQVSDIPVTCLLSSGIDSSVILGSISEDNKSNCSALTLDFDYKNKDNETIIAKKTAIKNNIAHKIENFNINDNYELIEKFFNEMDSPTNDGLNNYIVSHFAKKNKSKVIISGVGADELFCGYSSFKRIPKINNLMKYIPHMEVFNNFSKSDFFKTLKKFKLNTKYSGILEYGRNLSSAFFLQRSLFLPHEINEMISPKIFKNGFEELNLLENLNNDIKDIKDEKLSILYLEVKHYLCSKILKDSDWVSMSNSVEMRTPFVDWFFFKKLLPLLKSNITINKKNLLDCVKDKVPQEIYKRKKTGFNIPHKRIFEQLSKRKVNYSHPIKDWSNLAYEKYVYHEKKKN